MHPRSTTKNLPLRALFCVHAHQRSHLLFSTCFVVEVCPVLSLPYSLLSATCSLLSVCSTGFLSLPSIFVFTSFTLNVVGSSFSSSITLSPSSPHLMTSLSLFHPISPLCFVLSLSLCLFLCCWVQISELIWVLFSSRTSKQSSHYLGDRVALNSKRNTQRNLHTHTHAHTQACARTNTKYTPKCTGCTLGHDKTYSHLQMLCSEKWQILNYWFIICPLAKIQIISPVKKKV